MRQTYKDVSLDRDKLDSDPFNQFELWFGEADQGEPIPNLLVLRKLLLMLNLR